MRVFLTILAGFVLAGLAGCGGTKERLAEEEQILLPLPSVKEVQDPDSALLVAAVEAYLKQVGAPANSRYEFARIDLNQDGRRDGLVLFHTPYHYWCGMNGCRMLVFRARHEAFEMVSKIGPVRGPLTISENVTNGWHDIVVRVSGRPEMKSKDVALRFDGRNYPAHPAWQVAMSPAESHRGVRIFP